MGFLVVAGLARFAAVLDIVLQLEPIWQAAMIEVEMRSQAAPERLSLEGMFEYNLFCAPAS